MIKCLNFRCIWGAICKKAIENICAKVVDNKLVNAGVQFCNIGYEAVPLHAN